MEKLTILASGSYEGSAEPDSVTVNLYQGREFMGGMTFDGDNVLDMTKVRSICFPVRLTDEALSKITILAEPPA